MSCLPNKHIWCSCLFFSGLAWHKKRHRGPIHLQRVHNNPLRPLSPLPIPHSFSAMLQHKTATTVKRDVGAVYKSSSLLHYQKKKGKRICHGPLCLLYGSLVVEGTHVTLRHKEREQGWESLPNPPPSQSCGARRPDEAFQSTPAPPPPPAAAAAAAHQTDFKGVNIHH